MFLYLLILLQYTSIKTMDLEKDSNELAITRLMTDHTQRNEILAQEEWYHCCCCMPDDIQLAKEAKYRIEFLTSLESKELNERVSIFNIDEINLLFPDQIQQLSTKSIKDLLSKHKKYLPLSFFDILTNEQIQRLDAGTRLAFINYYEEKNDINKEEELQKLLYFHYKIIDLFKNSEYLIKFLYKTDESNATPQYKRIIYENIIDNRYFSLDAENIAFLKQIAQKLKLYNQILIDEDWANRVIEQYQALTTQDVDSDIHEIKNILRKFYEKHPSRIKPDIEKYQSKTLQSFLCRLIRTENSVSDSQETSSLPVQRNKHVHFLEKNSARHISSGTRTRAPSAVAYLELPHMPRHSSTEED